VADIFGLSKVTIYLNVQTIHWTFYLIKTFSNDMGIYFGGFWAFMTQEVLNIP
jgi:hypothetical protein